MRRIFLALLLVLCVCLCATFTACGDEEEAAGDKGGSKQSTNDGGGTNNGGAGGGNSSTADSSDKGGSGSGSTDGEKPSDVHTHTFGEWQTVTEPTCTEDGERQRACQCGERETEALPALGHTYTDPFEFQSSCEGDDTAYTAQICKVCGIANAGEGVIVLHPHVFEEFSQEADCENEGIEDGFRCKKCGYVATRKRVDALGHSYGDYIYADNAQHYQVCSRCDSEYYELHTVEGFTVVKEATCYETGSKMGVCFDCLYEVTKEIPIKHEWDKGTVTVAATCISSGEKLYICTICGATKTETVFETPHPYDKGVVTEEATCTKNGSVLYTCTFCEATKTEVISALGHNWDDGEVIKEADCYNIGVTHYVCLRCGLEDDLEYPKYHEFDGGEQIVEPTCTSGGVVRYTCTACGVYVDLSISPVHNEKYVSAKDATCTEDGYKAHYYCTKCQLYFLNIITHSNSFECDDRTYTFWYDYEYQVTTKEELVIAKTGHKFSTELEFDDETHYFICLNNGCGAKSEEENHSLAEVCKFERERDGDLYRYLYVDYLACDTCEYEKVLKSTEFAHEHIGVEIISGVDPTCTRDGLTKGLACSVYGCEEIYIEQEIIPALGHEYVEGVCIRCFVGSKDGTPGLKYTKSSDGTGYILSGIGSAQPPFIVVASEYDGLPVIGIADNAFKNNYDIASIVIPASIKTIGANAFYGCYKLVEVYNLSDTLTISKDESNGYVGNYALDIYTDMSAKSKLFKTTDGYLFYLGNENYLLGYYGNEVELALPNMIMQKWYSVYSYAFYSNKSIVSIRLGLKTRAIGAYAFSRCETLESITFSNYVTSVKDSAFYESMALKGVHIRSVESWCKISFADSYANPLCYAQNLYLNGELLTNLVILSTVKAIGDYAFYNCVNITGVTILGNVTSIGKEAFYSLYNLTSIKIPSSVTVMGEDVFDDCTCLTVYCEAASRPSNWKPNWNGSCPVVWNCNDNDVADDGYIYTIIDGIRYCIYSDKAMVARQPRNHAGNIVIPSSIKYKGQAYAVTSIGYGAFQNCTSLTSIEIPSSVTSISRGAFSGCTSLTSIEIPNGITSIGEYAFSGCKSLTSIEIPSRVTSIDFGAFSGCTSLTSIEIPSSVTSIGDTAFFNCTSLTSIEIPSGVTSIGDYAFDGCKSLTSVEIPSSVTSIGEAAFYGCTSLTSVVFGEGSQLTSIGEEAFRNCTSLTSIEIPSSVTSIDDWAFCGCESLISIKIPSSVTSIGFYAFSSCTSLTSIEILRGVTSIGEKAFHGCTSLTSVVFGEGSQLTSIGEYAFWGCTSLTSIEIPSRVTSIGDYAFRECTRLASVIFEKGSQPTSIGRWMFYECSSLTSIEIPSSVTSIGEKAFYECTSLTSIEIPSGVTNIGDSAFFLCENLTSVVFGEGSQLTSIGKRAFYKCASLTSIEIPSGVTSIGEYAFYDCTSLTSVVFGEGSQLTSIGDRAFYFCVSLTSIEIPSSVTSIGEGAFSSCTNLTIYCEAESKPEGWDSNWNSSNRPVVWGYLAQE